MCYGKPKCKSNCSRFSIFCRALKSFITSIQVQKVSKKSFCTSSALLCGFPSNLAHSEKVNHPHISRIRYNTKVIELGRSYPILTNISIAVSPVDANVYRSRLKVLHVHNIPPSDTSPLFSPYAHTDWIMAASTTVLNYYTLQNFPSKMHFISALLYSVADYFTSTLIAPHGYAYIPSTCKPYSLPLYNSD